MTVTKLSAYVVMSEEMLVDSDPTYQPSLGYWLRQERIGIWRRSIRGRLRMFSERLTRGR